MGSRREDQFVYVVSSDGCSDVYPENRQSNFKILLKDPIEFPPDEDWEVGLIDLHYPFSWHNIGGETLLMYVNGEDVSVVEFPDWQCGSLKDVCDFIRGELEPVTKLYKVGVDQLGRFCMESESVCCDVGFSDSLRGVLGLSSNDPSYTYSAMSQRASHRTVLAEFWKNGVNPLDSNAELFGANWVSMNAKSLVQALRNFIDLKKLQESTKYDKEEVPETNIDGVADVFGLRSISSRFATNFRVFESHFRALYLSDFPPKVIISDQPPVLNPAQQLHIHTNIIKPVDLNDTTVKLLRIVNVKGAPGFTSQEVFSHPTYQPLQKGGKISMIHVYIEGEDGKLVPFVNGRLLMTLHFRKQRYRR